MTQNGTIAYINAPKECDFCRIYGTDSEKQSPARAEYDFKTDRGPWANGCAEHYKRNRMYPDLGVGKGQKLEVRS